MSEKDGRAWLTVRRSSIHLWGPLGARFSQYVRKALHDPNVRLLFIHANVVARGTSPRGRRRDDHAGGNSKLQTQALVIPRVLNAAGN